MANNGAKDGVIELGGSEFRRVKNGLDEAQVASFINELISQRDTLAQRMEHLSTLTKLAEKTVTEADKLAEEIKTEAMNQAKTESAAIIAKAEEQAAVIKAEAERKAELLLENERKRIESELGNFVDRLHSQLISELERFKQQLSALQKVKSEHRLSQSAEGTSPVTMKADEKPNEFQELIQPVDQISTSEPEWELEILPPMDIFKIMRIVTYLDGLPEVENTEIVPKMDRPSILVFMREPIPLVDVLRALPEVAQVKEEATDTADGKPKKVQIALPGKTVPDKGNSE